MASLTVTFEVTPDGGDPYRLTVDTRDMYTWEKTTQNKAITLQQAMEELRLVELYRMAWIAARRQGMYSGTLDEFAATHLVEPTGDEDDEEAGEEAVPTRPGASPGPSSPSPSSPASPRRSGPKKATAPS
jgi:hypothetical protein